MSKTRTNIIQAIILLALCAWGYANATGQLSNAITFDMPQGRMIDNF
jgi:hypothetical protein